MIWYEGEFFCLVFQVACFDTEILRVIYLVRKL